MNCEAQIEDVLRLHPGVRAAMVVRRDDAIQAFVVPNDKYIDEVLGFGSVASTVLGKWRKIFDLTQFTKQAASAPVGFNTLGWNNSFTRKPIPDEEMREWVNSTVAAILPLGPRLVYEVGCGTGMILVGVAPHCERYIGADFSSAALASVQQQLLKMPVLSERVQLLERTAENFEGVDANSVDTVIINSVVQHFPSVSYLTKVLENAVDIVKDGGHVFVGDVLSLTLQPLFASSVVLFQAKEEDTVAELRARIQRRIDMEQQLVLSPAYFLGLKRQFPRVSSVEIRLRRDECDNEMSRYRYHAVLHVGHEAEAPSAIRFVDWATEAWGWNDIRSWLLRGRGECLGIKGIGNARLEDDLAMLARLTAADAEDTWTSPDCAKAARRGVHPRELIDMGAGLGFEVILSWAACRSDGRYDAAFVPKPQASACLAIEWPQAEPCEFARVANAPGQNKLRAELVHQLLSHCREKLPQELLPGDIRLVDALTV